MCICTYQRGTRGRRNGRIIINAVLIRCVIFVNIVLVEIDSAELAAVDFDLFSIPNIVLEHENKVEKHRHEAEAELDGVSDHACPIVGAPAVDQKLKNAQRSAGKVEQNVDDGPSKGRLSFVVEVHLGNILDARNEKLHVGQKIYKGKPGPQIGS